MSDRTIATKVCLFVVMSLVLTIEGLKSSLQTIFIMGNRPDMISTVNYQLRIAISTVNCQLSTVNCQLFIKLLVEQALPKK
jgi:hypothetical protein